MLLKSNMRLALVLFLPFVTKSTLLYISGLSHDAPDTDDKKDDIPIHRTKGHLYHALFKKAKYQFDCYHREMQYIVKCGSDLYKGTFVGYQISNTLLV